MALQLNLNTDTAQRAAGFRLARLEVLNWGTFDGRIWDILPEGANALLTGDIGSGKSTLVDAVTTLLVPPRKITFNKAAGAETRERNLKSYVRGAYKNEKVEHSGKARDVYLRSGEDHYTVLLAVFANEGLNSAVSLAQVLWMQDDSVRKFYVLAQHGLSIMKDFADFGADIRRLKRRLRATDGCQVYNSFNEYSNRFRQLFGIRQPEALDLFYQTVSMKSVGNLTDFVREQMLGQTTIRKNIDELVSRYQDLTEAHRAVRIAKEQRELLDPIIANADKAAAVVAKIRDLEAVVEEIPRYFARRRFGALRRQLRTTYERWQHNEAELNQAEALVRDLRRDLDGQRAALAGLGVNQRLKEIELMLAPLETERDRRKQQAEKYAAQAQKLTDAGSDFPTGSPTQAAAFLQNRQRLETLRRTLEATLDEIGRGLPDLYVRRDRFENQIREIEDELTSLRQRPTQIPERNLRLRQELLRELGLTAEDLPFAGELLRVRESAADWEGAVERQLHGFGLSLLVADRHYAAVSQLVERKRLSGKLVYLRTLEHSKPPLHEPEADSLVHKVRIKGDTEFYDWLQNELWLRHDYTCCDTLEQFRRARRGLTRQGQSKSSRTKHTKDDRYAVNDRRRYILGWTNKDKIAALEQAREEERQSLRQIEQQLAELKAAERRAETQRALVRELLHFDAFETIDYATPSARVQELREERQALEQASGELRMIQEKIRELEQRIAEAEADKSRYSEKRGGLRTELIQTGGQAYELLELLELPPPTLSRDERGLPNDMAQLQAAFTDLDPAAETASPLLRKRLEKEAPLPEDLKSLNALQLRMVEGIRGSRGAISRRREDLSRLERNISRDMQDFRNRYPEETREIDADIRSIPEFRGLYERLVSDDIPRHEARFREMLKEGAIRGILSFRTRLEEYEREIKEKIASINEHLHEIDYAEGTYITITAEPVRTDDIIDFKQQLRACLDNIYGEQDNIYTEEKFLQVKTLLDRFRGETEEDARWTRRVTDVRQWYTFGADERWREDDSSKEYYSDSSGKSGGQKEKLAYTILASAIAFQFGLEWGKARDRSFRFVVIDEAFGRGSDESTRYGLKLFARLNLQLLIVTPLQKINVIEDYIENVHFVSNPTGTSSQVRNISKREYEAEKAAHQARGRNA